MQIATYSNKFLLLSQKITPYFILIISCPHHVNGITVKINFRFNVME